MNMSVNLISDFRSAADMLRMLAWKKKTLYFSEPNFPFNLETKLVSRKAEGFAQWSTRVALYFTFRQMGAWPARSAMKLSRRKTLAGIPGIFAL